MKDVASKTNFKSSNPDLKLENERRKDSFNSLQNRWAEDEEKQKQMFAETRNLFDYEELVNAANNPIRLVLPDLGFFITYCPLTSVERNEIRKIKHHDEDIKTDMRNRKAVSMMIEKANPEVPDMEKKVNNLPAEWVDAILLKIGAENNRFLLPLLTNALRGYKKMRLPKGNF